MKLAELKNRQKITKSCIVLSTGRSGSNLLCSTLSRTGIVGNPREFFHEDITNEYVNENRYADFYDYLEQVLQKGTSANGVFSVKLQWDHFKTLVYLSQKIFDELQGKTKLEVISYLFPNPKYIYLRRRNTLRQAISMLIARQSGLWVVVGEQKPKQARTKKFVFEPIKLYRYKIGVDARNARWKQLLEQSNEPFHELEYESLAESFKENMKDVFSFLEIDFACETLTMPTKKQSSDLNDRWYRYYNYIPEKLIQICSELRTNYKGILKGASK